MLGAIEGNRVQGGWPRLPDQAVGDGFHIPTAAYGYHNLIGDVRLTRTFNRPVPASGIFLKDTRVRERKLHAREHKSVFQAFTPEPASRPTNPR